VETIPPHLREAFRVFEGWRLSYTHPPEETIPPHFRVASRGL
jgi:hypothetical protein